MWWPIAWIMALSIGFQFHLRVLQVDMRPCILPRKEEAFISLVSSCVRLVQDLGRLFLEGMSKTAGYSVCCLNPRLQGLPSDSFRQSEKAVIFKGESPLPSSSAPE